MKLNRRHKTAKIIPTAAKKKKTTVTGIATVTYSFKGTPSIGASPSVYNFNVHTSK